jgi:hypothetical protein
MDKAGLIEIASPSAPAPPAAPRAAATGGFRHTPRSPPPHMTQQIFITTMILMISTAAAHTSASVASEYLSASFGCLARKARKESLGTPATDNAKVFVRSDNYPEVKMRMCNKVNVVRQCLAFAVARVALKHFIHAAPVASTAKNQG